jgi:opacity protein-like surface antigen
MKKISASVLAFAAVGVLAMPDMAHARDNIYLAARGGYAATSMGKMFGKSQFGDDVGTFSVAVGGSVFGLRSEIEALTRTKFKNNDKKMDSYNLTFNLMYEADLGFRLKPFVGASVGASYNKMKQSGLKTQKHTNFVFGPMGGLTYDVTDAFSVDFTYKYLVVDRFKTAIGKKDLVSNEYTLGLRYKF